MPGAPIRLLLVDDEVGYLEVLDRRMSKRGLAVTTAPSGGEAIKALRGAEFDVAVVDLKMQDMDGIEVMKVLRTMDPGLSVIILTGHGSERDKETCLELGAFAYLEKPVDIDRLSQVMQEAYDAIGRRRG